MEILKRFDPLRTGWINADLATLILPDRDFLTFQDVVVRNSDKPRAVFADDFPFAIFGSPWHPRLH